jgi:sugar-phosphatase
MIPERIAAVLFDLDGVLVDSSQVVETAWLRWASAHNLPPAEVLGLIHGRRTRDVIRMLAPGADVEEHEREIGRYEMQDSDRLRAMPGAEGCVNLVRGMRWAVVTSGGRQLATHRLTVAALPVPSVLVAAEDVSRGKPDPEPYESACRALGVHPTECLVIEDAPAGIAAARSAGIGVLAVTTTHEAAALGDADEVFPNMQEIGGALLRLLSQRDGRPRSGKPGEGSL